MPEPFYVTTPIYYVNDAPAHRARVHHGRGRRAGPVATAVGRRRRVPHRYRRTRAQDPARRRGPGGGARGVGRPQQRPLPCRVGRPRRHLRRLHPHHRAPPPPRGAGVPATGPRLGRHRARQLRGPLLRRLRALLQGRRARRRPPLPDPRHGRRARHRAELLLPALALRGPPARPLHRAPRSGATRGQAQRGARAHQAGPPRLLDQPHVDLVGDPAAVGSRARRLRVVRRARSTTAPRSAIPTSGRDSTATGRRTTTSSARTSSGSTRCTGPRC